MRPLFCLFFAVVVLTATLAPAPVSAADEMFKRAVFRPELLIRNQRQIGFTPGQREVFLREMQETQAELLPIQLEMSEVGADLVELLGQEQVDEESTLETAMRMLELERQTKLRHMRLLIRIKNLLTPEQRMKLRRIRDSAGGGED